MAGGRGAGNASGRQAISRRRRLWRWSLGQPPHNRSGRQPRSQCSTWATDCRSPCGSPPEIVDERERQWVSSRLSLAPSCANAGAMPRLSPASAPVTIAACCLVAYRQAPARSTWQRQGPTAVMFAPPTSLDGKVRAAFAWTLRASHALHSVRSAIRKKGHREGGLFWVVEAAGIEPASEGTRRPALHA